MPRPVNIVRVAHQFLGVPYVWGGDNPATGLDCSGFLQNVFRRVGVNIPRTTYDQFKVGQPVGLHQLRPGDAVFIEPGKSGPNHVGMYIGNGLVQQSPHTGTRNSIMPLKDFVAGGFVGARRYAGGLTGAPLSGPTARGIGGNTTLGQGNPQALELIQSVLARNAQAQAPTQPQVAAPVQRALGGSVYG